MTRFRFGIAVLLLAWMGLAAGPSSAQAQMGADVGFTQVTRPVAEITDTGQIDDLLNEMLIIPEIPVDSINRVEVIDITLNGYGPDDVLVVYPSQETFKLDPEIITGRVQQMMNSWVLEADFQYDGANAPADVFRPDSGQADMAQNAIMADVIETIDRNYNGDAISLLFERSGSAFTVQMWDYQPLAMNYTPRPAGPPDTVLTRDLLYVIRSDSVLYDVMYINRTVEETVYIPEGGPTSEAPMEVVPRPRAVPPQESEAETGEMGGGR
ncbi:MAG: hypothetical protein GVY35_18290 [Bacteroidetes bacterium]|jgi:hypothetical protein|nr:hypothetical protein [Bacteroidota bacterium]